MDVPRLRSFLYDAVKSLLLLLLPLPLLLLLLPLSLLLLLPLLLLRPCATDDSVAE